MTKRLFVAALIALPIFATSAPEAHAGSAITTALGNLSSYGASVTNSLRAMLTPLSDTFTPHAPAASGADLPPIAVVKFSTTNTDGNPVPCELTLAKLRAVMASFPPSATDKARFEYLKNRGMERCRASDDRQANAYLSEALGMVGR